MHSYRLRLSPIQRKISKIEIKSFSIVHYFEEKNKDINFKVAKIFVNADITKELPSKINFTKNGVSSLVEFIYPWLPLRCSACGKWGHTDKVCNINKKNGTGESMEQTIKEEEVGEKNHEVKETGALMEAMREEVKENDLTQKEALVENEKIIEEGEIVESWKEVTPGKGSKSPKQNYGQANLLTPSRYSTLLSVDEEGVEIRPDEYEEILSVEEEVIEEGIPVVMSKEKEEIAVTDEAIAEIYERKDQEENNIVVIAGIEHWLDLTANSLRPSLPRRSKTLHKIVPDKISKKVRRGRKGIKTHLNDIFFSGI